MRFTFLCQSRCNHYQINIKTNHKMEKFKPFLTLLFFALGAFTLHFLIFKMHTFEILQREMHHSLLELYLIFLAIATIMVLLVTKVSELNQNYIGLAFLAGTGIKMLFVYLIGRPIFAKKTVGLHPETLNYLIIFFVFLVIEVIITAQLLNKKQ
jgi:hypothetical protein